MNYDHVVMYSIVLTKERLDELLSMGCVFGTSTAYKHMAKEMRVYVTVSNTGELSTIYSYHSLFNLLSGNAPEYVEDLKKADELKNVIKNWI